MGAGIVPLAAGPANAAAGAAAPTPVLTTGVWGLDFGGGVLNTVELGANGEQWVMERHISADGSLARERVSRGSAGTYAAGARLTADAFARAYPHAHGRSGRRAFTVLAATGALVPGLLGTGAPVADIG